MSEFQDWFEAQHGTRQQDDEPSDIELSNMWFSGQAAAETLKKRRLWDEKRTSALYAWQAARRPEPPVYANREE